ncbi:hypothetical protein [Chitinophaga qingshengii]|uniref:DUF3303 domain-containing protein n=1 Tax=Chitinophaga qingshengii TaxID=1569794 RepID=A0ABR7TYS9_9BACT|nr:hypothetical protein [Chitinophaga qingshengii]MBC9934947.1 hypothetical protein [Chitinophaga qingshengii]
MRTLLKVIMDVTAGNEAIKNNRLPEIIKATIEKIKPEAAFFLAEEGCRTGYFVFDMKDPAEIPGIAEPFFMELKAKLSFQPVMNPEDLKKGLAAAIK